MTMTGAMTALTSLRAVRALAVLGLLAAISSLALVPTRAATPGRVLRVPQDYSSVGAAVQAAQEHDLVLIGPGTYHEAIQVTTPYLTIRGVDRNTVIFEGDKKLDNAFYVNGANYVELSNMTARDYTANGFEWDKVTGFKGSFLTAFDNTEYGVYAFRSTLGEMSYSYGSGNGDSGFYIGACFDCKAVITDVHAENNGLGYSGTNAGGILIKDSEWNNNVAGIVPNTLTSEDDAPQGGKVGNVITNNYVHDNQNASAPSTFQIGPLSAPIGMGIEIAGGWNNQVIHNKVRNQSHYGIVLHYLITPTVGNQVQFNDISNSGDADVGWDGIGANNCFEENTDNGKPATLDPPTLEQANSCGPVSAPVGGDPVVAIRTALGAAGITDPKSETKQPKPGPQSTMPDPCVGAPPGCGQAKAAAVAAPPANVVPATRQQSAPDGYASVTSLASVDAGLRQQPTVDDVRQAMRDALANLQRSNLTVDAPAAQPDVNGYAATAMGVAALFLLIGAALGYWRHTWMPVHGANFPPPGG
ncbi:MAG: hypothetical protein QOK05_2456 [Chloroflexota bacterium]|jgi:hypothetical protein|nr:hypothetical protein [Chloroflexota bacterium]